MMMEMIDDSFKLPKHDGAIPVQLPTGLSLSPSQVLTLSPPVSPNPDSQI